MEDNLRMFLEFKEEDFKEFFYGIRKAIIEVEKQGFNEKGIQISAPLYFLEVLDLIPGKFYSELSSPFERRGSGWTCYGYNVNLSHDNFIIVFHQDMPQFSNSSYVLLDLKRFIKYKDFNVCNDVF